MNDIISWLFIIGLVIGIGVANFIKAERLKWSATVAIVGVGWTAACAFIYYVCSDIIPGPSLAEASTTFAWSVVLAYLVATGLRFAFRLPEAPPILPVKTAE